VIFAARGVMVSLAFFAILYSFLSLLLVLAWHGLQRVRQVKFSANALFWLRLFPFALSATITVFLTFPSFLLFEAHSLDEDFGTFALCLCALLLLGAGLLRVVTTQARTRHAVSEWLQANRAKSGADTVSQTAKNALPIMLVGIRAPRVLVSETARALLTEGELHVAVQHEMEHLRSRDNLRKAIFNFVLFPGMARLERRWLEAAELDADLGAVSNRKEALDLASALVKLSRRLPSPAVPALATGLIGTAESVVVRVERLLEWESEADSVPRFRYLIPVALATILTAAAHLGPALNMVHSLTERLVP
jgi:beta-lactamase regulating signal transducer with metallopeptidase domain